MLVLLAGAACAAFLASCATAPKSALKHEMGESVVFVGEQPAALAWLPAVESPLRVRSTYLPATNTIDYIEGRDFVLDYANGTLCRTAESRLADFQTNILYGQDNFDHSLFPGFGNDRFFAYVDYSLADAVPWPVQASQAKFLRHAQQKLATGEPLKIVAFGDSITAGSNVSTPEHIFWMRWVETLKHRYPDAKITPLNRATGGDTTAQGLARLKTKVIDEHPDLVLLGFGMNDHNVAKFGISVEQFERNLETMVTRIRQETGAEIILYSAFPPNPKWKFGSHCMADYAAATARVARRFSCAYADVYDNWLTLARRKKPEDLLANDINHPNDFGHWIYYRVFCSIGLTDSGKTADSP
jgi:acyl-CoA thioesterase-1